MKILEFLGELDQLLAQTGSPGEHMDLYQIGPSAIVLQYGARAPTRDIDFVAQRTEIEEQALGLAGQGTPLAVKHGLYLERVWEGLPPVPGAYRQRAKLYERDWRVLRLWAVEPNDLAAMKLKRFSAKDREDIRFLCDQGLIDFPQLQQRLESEFMWDHEKDGDPDREAAFANLEVVRQYLEGERAEL